MNIKKSILLRVRIAFVAVLIFAIAIISRIGKIQFVEGSRWAKIAKQVSFQHGKVKATRGTIYSDNGSLMATSLPVYRVAFDPTIPSAEIYRQGIDSLARLLSRHFGDKPPDEYKRRIQNARVAGKKYLLLNNQEINYQDKKKMASWPVFRAGRLKGGVIFEKVEKRIRPFSHLGTRTIGFIDEDQNGAGLEYSFNKFLSGEDGVALFQKLAGGNWKPVHDGSEVRPVDGWDIETTIDINLQDVSESALFHALKEHDADYGCVVVMEVETGEIKAISNLSKNISGNYWERINYAIGPHGLTEPGSTFKLVSMIALFEDTNLQLTDSIDTGNGEFKFYKHTMRDSKPGGYGKITIKDAFAKSSNIAISRLINEQYGFNPQKYIDHIDRLGLKQPLGFQIMGEGVPYIKTPTDKSWSGISLPWMSHGYELKLTPLQILSLYNAVANEGVMIQPIIVRKAYKANKIFKEFEPTIINKKICSEATLEKLKEMLEEVVEHGTASNIKDSYYKIAGKTGTAQKLIDGKYSKGNYYTSFAGYFPADRPKYSCIVVIDNPKGYKQYGSDVAAPVFKEIADKIYARDIEMHSPFPKEYKAEQGVFPLIQAGNQDDLRMLCNEFGISNHKSSDTEDWVKAMRVNNSIQWKERKIINGTVPDVQGMVLKDALYLLENNGLRVQFSGKGRVVKQSLHPGAKIKKGSEIQLVLS